MRLAAEAGHEMARHYSDAPENAMLPLPGGQPPRPGELTLPSQRVCAACRAFLAAEQLTAGRTISPWAARSLSKALDGWRARCDAAR